MFTPNTLNGQSPAEHFARMWQPEATPPDVFTFLASQIGLSPEIQTEICTIDQDNRWRIGIEMPVERYLESNESIRNDKRLTLELIKREFHCLSERGLKPAVGTFISRFPDFGEILRSVLLADEQPTQNLRVVSSAKPFCKTLPLEDNRRVRDDITRDAIEYENSLKPDFIGPYRVIRILGDGGFGRVYLAYDEVLKRNIAIKTPHPRLVSKPADVESYLVEARIVCSLDHQSIVPVYACGHIDNGLCYVVSKYIDGCDLATQIKRTPLSNAAAADLIISIADALTFAHEKGVVHRDVKPANILIDSQGRPYLADFGIALREEDFGTGFTRLGTIVYMSPEQLRGEGHLVDGRSDIFSLGVVLYELLTGRRPFSSNRLENSANQLDPKSPRQIDESIPKELERICLKAMAHRVIDRYSVASDMSADLRLFLQLGNAPHMPPQRALGLSGNSHQSTSGLHTTVTSLQIVPKGLRSFDSGDANFFLELLPGPKDRDGLPESIRFWKSRILATDAETFRIGVIYGPSGCGKSSLLKAGVIPQLPESVIPIYVEATPLETEARLLNGLRRSCPDLPADLGLAESMMALRRRRKGTSSGRVLIVIDQFEQWLHTRSGDDSTPLQRALRQCDGTHIQCIITVRDDFWMAVTDFMSQLEVDLIPGRNLAVVDLFNVRHAKKVLTAIGQAYGCLPSNPDEISKDEKAFISKAISDLSSNERVIPVQLALFAEMVKNKTWILSTIKALGGASGVGETFLEETFSDRTTFPNIKSHQEPTRAIMRALLPEGTSGIKGVMRSYRDLLEAAEYHDRPQEFDSLLQTLDSELRLITPTEPDGLGGTTKTSPPVVGETLRFYHLTHDYLVPSLQAWLTRKQKETRQGRAELLLADREATWKRQPSNRTLPSPLESLNILFFASGRAKRASKTFLLASAKFYCSGILLFGIAVGIITWGTSHLLTQARAFAIVESLSSAKTRDVPKIIDRLTPYRQIVDPMLSEAVGPDEPSLHFSPYRLHSAMALLPVEPQRQSVVLEGMLAAAADDFSTIRDLLLKWGDKPALSKRLWTELLEPSPEATTARRFRAGTALAEFDGPSDASTLANWEKTADFLATQLVAEIRMNFGNFDHWVPALKPAGDVLSSAIDRIFTQKDGSAVDRFAAAAILAEFSSDQPEKLVNLLFRATSRAEYDRPMLHLKNIGESAITQLRSEFAATIPPDATTETCNRILKRQAYAAIGLLEFEKSEPLIAALTAPVDSMLSTYTEDRLSKLSVHPELLMRMIPQSDTSLRASLIRSLAGMSLDQETQEFRNSANEKMAEIFQTDPDPGVHSAAEWALRSWGSSEQLAKTMEKLASEGPTNDRLWYINRHGQTMVVFRGPIESRIGSPPDDPERESDENLIVKIIPRDFCVCTTEVTVGQFLEFFPTFRHEKIRKDTAPTPDCAMPYMTWFRAAEYCNWLSEKEGIPPDQWCYRKEAKIIKTVVHPEGENMETIQPVKDYLSLTGYRLSTEAEWEYACRAGTYSSRSWGNDPLLSARYAWSVANSPTRLQPVGRLCPNRFGLFDMYGNVSEWVQDHYSTSRAKQEIDAEDLSEVLDDSSRVTRGGHSLDTASTHRSANRSRSQARAIDYRLGFRLGRTLRQANLPH